MALKYFRDNLKSYHWILWVVVAIFIGLVFFEWGGVNRQQAAQNDVAATVGGEKITFEEFRRTYTALENNYRRAFGEQLNADLLKQFNLPRQALNQLIDRRILLQEARAIGLQATDDEVAAAILEIPGLKDESGNFIGTETYRRLLRANQLSVEQFERQMREEVLLDKLRTVLAQTAYVSDAEVKAAYRERAERVKIRYLQLPATQFADVTAEPAEVAAYFEAHRSEYELPEQRVVDYLLVDKVQMRREIEISDAEIASYYADHPDEFTREEQVRARHILFKVTPARPAAQAEADLREVRRRIEAGEDFEALAQELSEDEGSASRGGSLGYFGRNQMIKPFEDAAFNAQVGELVGPIQTDFGYHLIEVQDHRQGGLQPLEQVTNVVRSRLVGERVEGDAAARGREVAAALQKDGADEVTREQMQALATEQGLTFQTTEPFGSNDAVTGIGRSPEFTSAAFGLAAGAVAGPLEVPRGWVVMRLAEVLPPRVPELAEVQDQVRQAVEQEKRQDAAAARLAEVKSTLGSEGGLDQAAAQLGLEVTDSNELGRFDAIPGIGESRPVIDAALALDPGQLGGPVPTAQGAVLFEVVERKSFDTAEFEEAKASTRSGLESQRLSQLMDSVVELRKRDLKMTTAPGLLDDAEAPAGAL